MKFARKVAPELLFGFGNLLPRSRHFAINFEIGAAYQGTPSVNLDLAGTACAGGPGLQCQSIGTTAAIQANVASQQSKINHDITKYWESKFWPVVALGFGYKF